MLLFLATTPSLWGSLEILYENIAYAKSKLTRSEIGIIEASNKTYLIKKKIEDNFFLNEILKNLNYLKKVTNQN
jgi:hypothetical protein